MVHASPVCTRDPTVWQTGEMFVLFNKRNAISRALTQGLRRVPWFAGLGAGWSGRSPGGGRAQAPHIAKRHLRVFQNGEARTGNWLVFIKLWGGVGQVHSDTAKTGLKLQSDTSG